MRRLGVFQAKLITIDGTRYRATCGSHRAYHCDGQYALSQPDGQLFAIIRKRGSRWLITGYPEKPFGSLSQAAEWVVRQRNQAS